MKRCAASLLVLIAVLALAAIAVAPAPARAAAPPQVDPVISWNRTLLQILRTPGAQPATVHPTRSLAIMHLAIYGAVLAVDHRGTPGLPETFVPPDTSTPAAVDAAAHDALVGLYPARRNDLDAQFQESLGQVPDGNAKRDGIAVGQAVAQLVLALRSEDGSNAAPPPVAAGTTPGTYRPTPPNFAPAGFTHWSRVAPFTLAKADQFRPGKPAALSSRTYATALREVQRVGKDDSRTRTPDQTQIAKFWAAPIQNYWNEIAQTAALTKGTGLAENARLFALLNVTLADSTVALYDAKYAYYQWRPVTAIRLADRDGNPGTTADPTWTPLSGVTAPDPSYPGAHSTISTAAALVLRSVLGSDRLNFSVRSEALPGVERTFSSFSAAANEAGLSRIYAGQHTRVDHRAGAGLGADVARHVIRFDRRIH